MEEKFIMFQSRKRTNSSQSKLIILRKLARKTMNKKIPRIIKITIIKKRNLLKRKRRKGSTNILIKVMMKRR